MRFLLPGCQVLPRADFSFDTGLKLEIAPPEKMRIQHLSKTRAGTRQWSTGYRGLDGEEDRCVSYLAKAVKGGHFLFRADIRTQNHQCQSVSALRSPGTVRCVTDHTLTGSPLQLQGCLLPLKQPRDILRSLPSSSQLRGCMPAPGLGEVSTFVQ